MALQAGDTVIAPGLPNVQVFTGSGTWNKPDGVRAAMVELVGGGGGSGGAAATAAGQQACSAGGGGGGYSRKLIQASALGATETVTIGAGGAAGASGANAGTAGGTTSFGAHCSATGGGFSSGAAAVTADRLQDTGGGGGVGSSGDMNLVGGRGMPGMALGGFTYRAPGGTSQLSDVEPGGTTFGQAGVIGKDYGGGAGGACNAASQTAKAGGAGAGGVVIVTTYF